MVRLILSVWIIYLLNRKKIRSYRTMVKEMSLSNYNSVVILSEIYEDLVSIIEFSRRVKRSKYNWFYIKLLTTVLDEFLIITALASRKIKNLNRVEVKGLPKTMKPKKCAELLTNRSKVYDYMI